MKSFSSLLCTKGQRGESISDIEIASGGGFKDIKIKETKYV